MDLLKLLKLSPVELATALIAIIFFILFLSVLIKVKRLERRVSGFVGAENGADIEKALGNYVLEIKKAMDKIDGFQEQINDITKKLELSIKKVAIVRYNAFDEVGGDLSFSIALLDDHDDGVVITGIYGRNETTTYAKPIRNGTSNYKLSAEEIDVIEKAKRKFI
ncbi:DUF4446 family protein [Caldanaerobius polysaccharolyticus]|uniref:DUF4446 family protein n=1 Tax=Caldanaerobius polysaccharolyticus TaxID=44256 RepID=UPI0004787347|nr:DUF4446 family protein [Caldanaerobius polysaccharolyticus]